MHMWFCLQPTIHLLFLCPDRRGACCTFRENVVDLQMLFVFQMQDRLDAVLDRAESKAEQTLHKATRWVSLSTSGGTQLSSPHASAHVSCALKTCLRSPQGGAYVAHQRCSRRSPLTHAPASNTHRSTRIGTIAKRSVPQHAAASSKKTVCVCAFYRKQCGLVCSAFGNTDSLKRDVPFLYGRKSSPACVLAIAPAALETNKLRLSFDPHVPVLLLGGLHLLDARLESRHAARAPRGCQSMHGILSEGLRRSEVARASFAFGSGVGLRGQI